MPTALASSPSSPAGHDRWAPAARPQLELRLSEPVRFVTIAFEGPDPCSHAGGLAVRVTNLTAALAASGAAVDHFFIGDPRLPPTERRAGVTLHRNCQAITASPSGTELVPVYGEEERKIEDLCLTLPDSVASLVASDAAAGVSTVVLAEEWQTVWPLIAIHDRLVERGQRESVKLAWTANNRYGFERIDFGRLANAATIMTISRSMKQLMWGVGVNPLVVPNGLPDAAYAPVPEQAWTGLRAAVGPRPLLVKVGRWDPDKRWLMAIDAVARLRDRGDEAVLLARGWDGGAGGAAHYDELRRFAAAQDLAWTVCSHVAELGPATHLGPSRGAGVVEIAAPIDGAPLRTLYRAADAVLANSGFEPFGLVGLEAMAAAGIVITGSTGEEYVSPYRNGFALDTAESHEIVRCLDWLARDTRRAPALRAAARETALGYRWLSISERLFLALGLADPVLIATG